MFLSLVACQCEQLLNLYNYESNSISQISNSELEPLIFADERLKSGENGLLWGGVELNFHNQSSIVSMIGM